MEGRNGWCFACGSQNPIGLKLAFHEDNETYVTTFTPGLEHQGYDGIMHGGIVSTLLDEIMVQCLYAKGLNVVTAKLEVRFHKPTPIGQELTVRGRVTGKRGAVFELTSEVVLPDGTVTAEGKAKVVLVGEFE